MQEELERKSISVTVQATKLTGRVMRAAVAAALAARLRLIRKCLFLMSRQVGWIITT